MAIQIGALDLGRASLDVARELPRVLNWLPLRVSALHFCTDDALTGGFFRAAMMGLPGDIRARHRFHMGTYTESMYSLLGYGIPVDLFPWKSESGTIKTTILNRWIAKYIARDKVLAKDGRQFFGVDLPTRNDVLMGKDRPNQHHTGNVYLRVLVKDYLDEYQTARLSVDKSFIIDKVCSMIKANSGRFLQKDDGWWRESQNEDGVAKVRKLLQGTKRKDTPRLDHLAHTTPDNGVDDASIFLHQGKRHRFGGCCCCMSWFFREIGLSSPHHLLCDRIQCMSCVQDEKKILCPINVHISLELPTIKIPKLVNHADGDES